MNRYVRFIRDQIREGREAIERGRQFVLKDLWQIGKPGETLPDGFIIRQLRVAILLITNLARGTIMLRASALTFATILSIVPFLAVIFYLIQTFNLGESLYAGLQERLENGLETATEFIPGVHDEEVVPEEVDPLANAGDWGGPRPPEPEQSLEVPELAEAPPGAEDDVAKGVVEEVVEGLVEEDPQEKAIDDRNRRLQRQLLESIFRSVGSAVEDNENYVDPIDRLAALANEAATNKGVLSIAGILLFITTVFGLMQNIEQSVNAIWGVRRTRSWYRMFSDYLVITLLLPFVAACVLAITAALQSETIIERLGLLAYGLRGFQYGVIILVFTSLYYVVPNTSVRLRYAFLGGIVAGILWLLLSWSYVQFQIGVTSYNIVFSTFAQFPVLLMWIYLSWIILLFGAELSYAYQNVRTFAMERLAEHASYAYREAICLRTMLEVCRRFDAGESAFDPSEAAANWNVPSRLINEALENLESAELVICMATDPVTYHPGRPSEKIRVGDVLKAMREHGEDPSQFREDDRYEKLYEILDNTDAIFDGATVRQLLARIQLAVMVEDEVESQQEEPRGKAHAS